MDESLASERPLAWTAEARAPERRPRASRRREMAAGLFVAAAATALVDLPQPARILESTVVSGAAEPRLSKAGAAQRWHRRRVTIELDPTLDELGVSARDVVMHAFDAWTGAHGELPSLVFDRRAAPRAFETADGKNTVRVAAIDIEGHENDLAVTITYSDAMTGEIVESDIVLNARKKLRILDAAGAELARSSACAGSTGGLECESTYDLQSVVTHEIGHFFGLGEDSADATATMFRCTNPCETHKRELSAADRGAIAELYAPGSLAADDPPASAGCSTRAAGAADR